MQMHFIVSETVVVFVGTQMEFGYKSPSVQHVAWFCAWLQHYPWCWSQSGHSGRRWLLHLELSKDLRRFNSGLQPVLEICHDVTKIPLVSWAYTIIWYCIVLYCIYTFYIALLTVHTNQKRFQCEWPRVNHILHCIERTKRGTLAHQLIRSVWKEFAGSKVQSQWLLRLVSEP